MRLIFFLLISCYATTTLIGQICTDGSIPITRTVNLAGVNSWDGENDPDNEGGVLNFGGIGDIVGIDAQNVNFTTVGASWCIELIIKFNTNLGDLTGIYYTPSLIPDPICTDLPGSTGLVDLDALGLTIPTDPLGNIYWEVFESFDDVANAIDATLSSGTITLYHCPTGIILPLEVIEFDAELLDEGNRIYWSTINEVNVQWLLVERSSNGISDWKELYKVEGRNNGSETSRYEFIDEEPLLNGYYRLSEISPEGERQVYQTIHVFREPDDFELFGVYPNPTVDGIIFIDYYTPGQELVDIKVFSVAGQLLNEARIITTEGMSAYKMNLPKLTQGVYVIELTSNSKSIKKKVYRVNN